MQTVCGVQDFDFCLVMFILKQEANRTLCPMKWQAQCVKLKCAKPSRSSPGSGPRVSLPPWARSTPQTPFFCSFYQCSVLPHCWGFQDGRVVQQMQ